MKRKQKWISAVNGVAIININSISTNYNTPDIYDLCPKCLDEFAEFMKKEKNNNESISE